MNNTIKLSVNLKNSGKRLDIFLSENLENYTRSFLKKLIQKNQVKINNSIVFSPSSKVKHKDQIIINIFEENDQTSEVKSYAFEKPSLENNSDEQDDQKIIFGTANSDQEVESKFDKLKTFYTEAMEHEGWRKYKEINLKYEDQIVCKKKELIKWVK